MNAEELASNQAQIERWKQEGGVMVGGVRYAPAPRLADAFELGRRQENEDNTHYRVALRSIAEAFSYKGFAFNDQAVATFVAWMTGQAAIRTPDPEQPLVRRTKVLEEIARELELDPVKVWAQGTYGLSLIPTEVRRLVADLRQAKADLVTQKHTIDAAVKERNIARERTQAAEKELEDIADVVLAIRNMLWQGRPGQPGITSKTDRAAIVDAVRVLLESAQNYDRRFQEISASAQRTYAQAQSLNQERAQYTRKIRDLESEVDRMKDALAGERSRGYEAALKDVRRAARKLKEERE